MPNNENIESNTESKWCTDSSKSTGTSSGVSNRLWPIMRVHTMPVVYRAMTMITTTQAMPWRAASTPIARLYRGRTILTRRRMRTTRNRRMTRKRMMRLEEWWWPPSLPCILSSSNSTTVLTIGNNHWSPTPLATIQPSNQFQPSSSSSVKKDHHGLYLCIRANSSNTKKASNTCSTYHHNGDWISVSSPITTALDRITKAVTD
mmetsp:Transcript_40544/g.106458  ORF Transcript_40544/g.106458 Transcript_40544/m.106458 type:complete len:204 (+) Transcript_40544:950-1561(+)